VIFEELRLYLDTPVRHIHDVYEQLLFGDQPLGWDTVGTIDSLKNINRSEFLKFKDAYYNPENMLVSIAGGIKHSDIENYTKKYLGNLKNKKTATYEKVKVSQNKPAVKISAKKTEQAHLALGVRSYPRGHKNRYIAAVLNTILGSSMSSRLFIELRERRGLAYHISGGPGFYMDTGNFAIFAGLKLEKVYEGLEVIKAELERVVSEKVTSDELKKAKEMIRGRLALSSESTNFLAGYFGTKFVLDREIETFEEYLKNIDLVTAEDIKDVARELFQKGKFNLQVIGPFKEKGKFEKILS